MRICLDVGSHTIRMLGQKNQQLPARRTLAAYAVIVDAPHHRATLTADGVPFSHGDGFLLVAGDLAPAIARKCQGMICPLIPPLGIAHDDTLRRQVLAQMLDALLPAQPHGLDHCALILPTSWSALETNTADHLCQQVRQRGYRVTLLNAAAALVLAELSSSRFSGLALVMGASGLSYAVAHSGRILTCGDIAGGAWLIDEQWARYRGLYTWNALGQRALDTASAESERISLTPRLAAPAGRDEHAMSQLHDDLCSEWLSELGEALETDELRNWTTPLPVVCGGGLASAPEVVARLATKLDRTTLPVRLTAVRSTGGSPFSLCRGGLIHLELDALTQPKAA